MHSTITVHDIKLSNPINRIIRVQYKVELKHDYANSLLGHIFVLRENDCLCNKLIKENALDQEVPKNVGYNLLRDLNHSLGIWIVLEPTKCQSRDLTLNCIYFKFTCFSLRIYP